MRKQLFILSLLASVLLFTACIDFGGDDYVPQEDPDTFDDTNTDYISNLLAHYTFDNSDGTDATGNGNTAFFYGEPNYVAGVRGSGVFLNSFHDQYMNIPYNFFEGKRQWSVSFWIKDFGAGNIFAAQNSTSGSTNGDAPLFWASQDNLFLLKCKNGEVQQDEFSSFTYNYNAIQGDGEWHHIVVTLWKNSNQYNYNAKARLFVDGTLRDQKTCKLYLDCVEECSKIVFGGDKNGCYDYHSSMKLDEVRFYDRTLAAPAVTALYNSEKQQ